MIFFFFSLGTEITLSEMIITSNNWCVSSLEINVFPISLLMAATRPAHSSHHHHHHLRLAVVIIVDFFFSELHNSCLSFFFLLKKKNINLMYTSLYLIFFMKFTRASLSVPARKNKKMLNIIINPKQQQQRRQSDM